MIITKKNQNMLPSGNLTWLWKITIFDVKIHYRWPFSITMLVYQRVFQFLVGGFKHVLFSNNMWDNPSH